MSTKISPILWAVDPFDQTIATDNAKEAVEQLAKTLNAPVEVVSVLSRKGLNWTGEFSKGWTKRYKPLAAKAIDKKLQSLIVPTGKKSKILSRESKSSLREDVTRLLEYATRQKARSIVISSHARSGAERFFLGSFAETALLQTKIPLILTNPKTHWPKEGIRKIFVPTELTKESKKSLSALLPFVKSCNAELVLFHKLPDPVEPLVQTGVTMAGGGWVSVYQFLEKESLAKKNQARIWIEWLAKQGVKASFEIEEKPGFVANSIMERAKANDCQLIAIQSKSGPLSSFMIGSVTRQLARNAELPLLVTHS